MSAWPTVPLRELLRLDLHKEPIDSSKKYEMAGVLSFGRGLFRRPALTDGNTSYSHMLRLKAEHIVMSQLFGWEGALALSSDEFEGTYLSPNFPTFVADESRLQRRFLGWVMQRPSFWEELGRRAKGMGDRRRTLTPDALFQSTTPLPPLSEQVAIVANLDALSGRSNQLTAHLNAIGADADCLVAQRFREIIADAPYRPMAEVAPLVRREVRINPDASYPELGIRSFGKGTFHKPAVPGMELGTKRLFRIEAGDLVFSNVFAWEGAIAIASPKDAGRFGSHRFMTCVVDTSVAITEFVRYYLLAPEGMEKVRAASPGGAGRNRTLGVEKLAKMEVPAPSLARQAKFVALLATVSALKTRHAAIREASTALLPATLERLFAA